MCMPASLSQRYLTLILMERSGQVALDAVDGGRHAAVLAAEGVGDDFTAVMPRTRWRCRRAG